MIEAALLVLELFFVIALLWGVNNATKTGIDENFGVFHFKQTRTDEDTKPKKKGRNNA